MPPQTPKSWPYLQAFQPITQTTHVTKLTLSWRIGKYMFPKVALQLQGRNISSRMFCTHAVTGHKQCSILSKSCFSPTCLLLSYRRTFKKHRFLAVGRFWRKKCQNNLDTHTLIQSVPTRWNSSMFISCDYLRAKESRSAVWNRLWYNPSTVT